MKKIVVLAYIGFMASVGTITYILGKKKSTGVREVVEDEDEDTYVNLEEEYSVFKTCPDCKGKAGYNQDIMGEREWEDCEECMGLGYVPKFVEEVEEEEE